MKDFGYGVIRDMTATSGTVFVDTWQLGKFGPCSCRIQGSQLVGNDFPLDLTDLFAVNDAVFVTAQGQASKNLGCRCYCEKVEIVAKAEAAPPITVAGVVSVSEVWLIAHAKLGGEWIKIDILPTAYISPAATPYTSSLYRTLPIGADVVMRVTERSYKVRRGVPKFVAISVRLMADPDRFRLPHESQVAIDPPCFSSGSSRPNSNCVEMKHVACQTDSLLDEAARAVAMYANSEAVTQTDLLLTWKLCPRLVKLGL